MLELKFAIYHRAASLSSQASSCSRCTQYWLKNHGLDICSNTESTMDGSLSVPPNTNFKVVK